MDGGVDGPTGEVDDVARLQDGSEGREGGREGGREDDGTAIVVESNGDDAGGGRLRALP